MDSYYQLTVHDAVDNIASPSPWQMGLFPVHSVKNHQKFRVNPEAKRAYSPMAESYAIAKIVGLSIAASLHPKAGSYPRFLWTSLWITMFTSRPGRANIGLVQVARQMTRADNTAKIRQLPKLLKENP